MKRYFIDVKTYVGTNGLDTELNMYVKDKYDHAIINDESIDSMKDDIKCKIDELAKKYPRCKKKILKEMLINECPRIEYCKDADSFISGYVFILSTSLVIREYTEGVGL